MSKKAVRKPVSSATRRAKTAKVKSLKKPVEPKYVYSIVTMYDGGPGISDGQGNIAPFASLNGAQGRMKELVRGSSKHCHLVWTDPERYAREKLQWERDNPQTDEKPVEPQYVYTLVELKGGRWGISDGCGKVAPFGGSKIEVEGTRQRLVSEEFHHNRFAWTKEEPLHPVVENAPTVAHVWVQPGATSTIVEDTSKPPVWTAPVGMVLLDQAEHDLLLKKAKAWESSDVVIDSLVGDLKRTEAERDGLKGDVRQAESNSDELEVKLSRERGESAKWLNKYLQLCQLTGQRAEPEGLDHPACSLKDNPAKPSGEWSEIQKACQTIHDILTPSPNVFEQPASQLTKLERAALDLAPMLELSDLDTDVSIRRIERLVDFAASILSECHSQSK